MDARKHMHATKPMRKTITDLRRSGDVIGLTGPAQVRAIQSANTYACAKNNAARCTDRRNYIDVSIDTVSCCDEDRKATHKPQTETFGPAQVHGVKSAQAFMLKTKEIELTTAAKQV